MSPKTPDFSLRGRRALITGAGRGIGLAAAHALAQAGAHVVLAARTREQIDAACSAIRSNGGGAEAWCVDVTDPAAVRAGIEQLGPFPILVNNAGTNRPALLIDTHDDDIDAVLDLNVRAAIHVAREVARGLVAASMPGSLINISSQMGHVGGPRRTIYCATKHALEGFTKALAWELGPANIRVNSICPTFVETEMTRKMFEDAAFRDYVTSRIALGRMARLEDIMGAVVFLAGDAAAMVTGSALMVDGGWTAA